MKTLLTKATVSSFTLPILLMVIPGPANLLSFFVKRSPPKEERLIWQHKGPTPLAHRRYTPQGMTWANGSLIAANTWKDRKSRIYQIDPSNMQIKRTFDMPQEARHTSGLAWDGSSLWAVDYRSNRAYQIDLESSLLRQRAVVLGSFDTTLRGTSACAIVEWSSKKYLAVSDFMRTGETIFVDYRAALRLGTAARHILFRYRNEGFSQGLEYVGGYLYEAENKFGANIINKLDIEILLRVRDSRQAAVAQFRAPGKGVEDLAWSGVALWTSDEKSFGFYRGTFR